MSDNNNILNNIDRTQTWVDVEYNWSVEMEKVGHKMENSSDFIKNFPF